MSKIELLNIDCYEKLLTMSDGIVDLLLQDTPFGVTQNEWDVKPDLKKMWPEWERVTKINGAMIFFATQPFASELIISNKKNFRYDVIWEKSQPTGFLNANKMPMRSHESILVFYRKLPSYNPVIFKKPKQNIRPLRKPQGFTTSNYGSYKEGNFSKIDNDETYPSSILYFPNEQGNIHPTQKPLDLIRYLIKTYSNEGELIFDGYGGSLTTAVASEFENRNAIVCENNSEYYNDGLVRFREKAMQQKLFI